MRALLVVNPNATTMSHHVRDALISALANELDVSVATTQHRGHGMELAQSAAKNGVDVVVALGGDGIINEVVNGVLTAGVSPPLVGAVPAGSTNVFVRNLGFPRDPEKATRVLVEALRERRTRTINLGLMGDRYFTFCAGIGFDAEVMKSIEKSRARGKKATLSLQIKSAITHFFSQKRIQKPHIKIALGDEATTVREESSECPMVSTALVLNTAPATYVGNMKINPSPEASFSKGLDLFAIRTLSITKSFGIAISLLRGVQPDGPNVFRLTDRGAFTLTADIPLAIQADGEYLGETRRMDFKSVPNALTVLV